MQKPSRFWYGRSKRHTNHAAIGDAAAASGKGTQGLSQIGEAFGAIQVAGRLSLSEINRLQSNGVPALTILANEAGVAADTMRDQISSGAITADKAIATLVKGMQDGTSGVAGQTAAMAGIMEKTRDTWTGTMDQFKSGISYTMLT
ncbi:tape measure protein [Geomicrobium sp. JCM 19037]|uniref:tape measure protein n=1 Tax=Geomicrobium sp. JCM 19037 TaxID=1460634 RepID=UPI0009E0B45F|nr:tape measure protein [Geomicrobium sp. JCM 19037]